MYIGAHQLTFNLENQKHALKQCLKQLQSLLQTAEKALGDGLQSGISGTLKLTILGVKNS